MVNTYLTYKQIFEGGIYNITWEGPHIEHFNVTVTFCYILRNMQIEYY
jgi:hypothetical protein